MKFDHVVNYNGIYYKAGEEVPIEQEEKEVPVGQEEKTPAHIILDEEEQEQIPPKRRGRPSKDKE